MKRSYYQNSIENYIKEDSNSIFGQLSKNHQHTLDDLQKNAWTKQIKILKTSIQNLFGKIYFEFSIPRLGKRVDNILIHKNIIFVIEFKIGDTQYSSHAQNQTINYCLDLLNFHEGSHDKIIIPVLVATKAPAFQNDYNKAKSLEQCVLCNETNLKNVLNQISNTFSAHDSINPIEWENSRYKPTPTIIEAARALYKGHNFREISRNVSGAINLSKTANVINRIIEHSKANHKKSICFLTGVPGAGKTLAGLNIANERLKANEYEHSVFLSGNGPLVDVLREALTRDSVESAKQSGKKNSKLGAERKAKSFIQNIHHFRDDNLKSGKAPIENVVVLMKHKGLGTRSESLNS